MQYSGVNILRVIRLIIITAFIFYAFNNFQQLKSTLIAFYKQIFTHTTLEQIKIDPFTQRRLFSDTPETTIKTDLPNEE